MLTQPPLTLRLLHRGDIDALTAFFAHPRINYRALASWGDTPRAQAETWMQATEEDHSGTSKYHGVSMAVCRADTLAGLVYTHLDHFKTGADDLHWQTAPDYRGQGQAQLAVAVTLFAALQVGRRNFSAVIAPDNAASQAIARAIGLHHAETYAAGETPFKDAYGKPQERLVFRGDATAVMPCVTTLISRGNAAMFSALQPFAQIALAPRKAPSCD